MGGRVSNFELDPWWGATLRFLAAGLVFVGLVLVVRPSLGSRRTLLGAALYGLFAFGLQFAFLYWALQSTPAGTAQVLIALAPLATFGLAIAHGLETFRWRALFGGMLALLGVALVFADQLSAEVPIVSLLAVLAAAICLAESTVIAKLTLRGSPLVVNAIGMSVGAIFLGALSLAAGEDWVLPTQADTWVAIAFLVMGGSVAVFGLYVFILARWSASATSYSLLLSPLTTVVYGAALLGEEIGPAFLLGGVVILGGVWIGIVSPERWFERATAIIHSHLGIHRPL